MARNSRAASPTANDPLAPAVDVLLGAARENIDFDCKRVHISLPPGRSASEAINALCAVGAYAGLATSERSVKVMPTSPRAQRAPQTEHVHAIVWVVPSFDADALRNSLGLSLKKAAEIEPLWGWEPYDEAQLRTDFAKSLNYDLALDGRAWGRTDYAWKRDKKERPFEVRGWGSPGLEAAAESLKICCETRWCAAVDCRRPLPRGRADMKFCPKDTCGGRQDYRDKKGANGHAV